jgi:hypothetical protein
MVWIIVFWLVDWVMTTGYDSLLDPKCFGVDNPTTLLSTERDGKIKRRLAFVGNCTHFI